MTAYGYAYQHHALIGVTPEMLFAKDGRGYQTIALAGTRPVDRAAELLRDPKEMREHRMVVEDIVRRVAPFGNVEVEPIRIVELPSIAHLATPIRFEESGADRMSFADIVRRLHPTAALGAWPRTEAGERWLRDADRGVKRRTFGAPLGLERDERRGIALVAIRNLQWHGDILRVGSGAGVIAESRLEREFEELREKREQVKNLFGVGAAVHA
jgi:isochorismate synthase EntC